MELVKAVELDVELDLVGEEGTVPDQQHGMRREWPENHEHERRDGQSRRGRLRDTAQDEAQLLGAYSLVCHRLH